MSYQLLVKVREKGVRGLDRNLYKNEVNPSDPNLLILLFEDLINMFNIPFWKAVKIMEGKIPRKEVKLFPFSPE